MRPLESAAVLGAGTMGARLAAHLANAGLPVVLFDVSTDAAQQGLERLGRTRPPSFFRPEFAQRIVTRSFHDLPMLASADWILEAVVERLDVKRDLLQRVASHASPEAILSSNTSGLSVAAIAADRSLDLRRRWLGTHFFNPPRYLHLVEVVPTVDTAPDIVQRLRAFLDRRLGKGVVEARDTPGFIANRLGIFGLARILDVLASGELTIEDIDALTGPLVGRPATATFRTVDLVGLDVLAAVASDLARRLPDEEGRLFVLPPLVSQMIDRGLLGAKTDGGFYKRVTGGNGRSIRTLDLATLEYRELRPPRLAPPRPSGAPSDTATRLRALFLDEGALGAFLRRTLGATLVYAARIAPDVSSSIDDIDRAMRWGFGWELGPFEIWDAIGVRAVVDACRVTSPPALVRRILDAGGDAFRAAPLPPAAPDLHLLTSARDRHGVVRRNASASLVDLGEGVLGLELHSKLNTIGGETVEMLRAGVAEAARHWTALVIATRAAPFSAGANLLLVLQAARNGRWNDLDAMVRAFQQATLAVKASAVPVVAAPIGLALGGGCEICLHADRVQAAAETYMGLVEASVGLIPAGGGTTAMLLRADERGGDAADFRSRDRDLFEILAFASVSTSAPDALRLGYLRDVDGVTMNPERLVADARTCALERAAQGCQPAARRRTVRVGGEESLAVLSLGIHLARRAGRISEYDAHVAGKLAHVLAGGRLPHPATVDDTYLRDLEREAFLSLCGEPKTLERIGYTLKTGKPLRN